MKEKRQCPIVYNNICNSPPTTDRPATASLTPYETAALLLLVALALELELVLVPVPDGRVCGLDWLPSHVYVPWMTLLAPCSLSKVLQSRGAVLSRLKPPSTLVRAERSGL